MYGAVHDGATNPDIEGVEVIARPALGATAVDEKHHVLIEAGRGKQVDFAARGADVQAAAGAPNIYVEVRGTSFAAPIIAQMFAMDLGSPDPLQAELAVAKWKGFANDLGKPGRDDVYGEGELGSPRPGAGNNP